MHKVTFADLEELVERDNFDRIIDAAGPNSPSSKTVWKNWGEAKGLDASKFDDSACKKYETDFSKNKR